MAGGAGADPYVLSGLDPALYQDSSDDRDRDRDDSSSPSSIQSSYEQEAFGSGSPSSFSGFGNKSNRDDNKSTFSPSVQAAQDYTESKLSSFDPDDMSGFYGGFNKGGLAAKPKTKPKTKRNRKKGLGGNS